MSARMVYNIRGAAWYTKMESAIHLDMEIQDMSISPYYYHRIDGDAKTLLIGAKHVVVVDAA